MSNILIVNNKRQKRGKIYCTKSKKLCNFLYKKCLIVWKNDTRYDLFVIFAPFLELKCIIIGGL